MDDPRTQRVDMVPRADDWRPEADLRESDFGTTRKGALGGTPRGSPDASRIDALPLFTAFVLAACTSIATVLGVVWVTEHPAAALAVLLLPALALVLAWTGRIVLVRHFRQWRRMGTGAMQMAATGVLLLLLGGVLDWVLPAQDGEAVNEQWDAVAERDDVSTREPRDLATEPDVGTTGSFETPGLDGTSTGEGVETKSGEVEVVGAGRGPRRVGQRGGEVGQEAAPTEPIPPPTLPPPSEPDLGAAVRAPILSPPKDAVQMVNAPRKKQSCPKGMNLIEGGVFTSPERGKPIDRFCMDITEVTVADYYKCVMRGKCTPAKTETYCNASDQARLSRHPINCVNWNQAKAYCKSIGRELPTKSQWEWAAQGRDEARRYPWGERDPTCARAKTKDCSPESDVEVAGTSEVRSARRGASRDGLHDMAGNVWEWTVGGSGRNRTIKGGSWVDVAWMHLAVESSYSVPMLDSRIDTGFRCVRSPWRETY